MKIPDHIKEIKQNKITYECTCGDSASFNYPVDIKINKWWFDKHKKCKG